MELLSPAGSMDALMAAVQNGANAVYLGGEEFNARQFAGNFTDIEAAVSYAHLRDCKVYFVLNTLLLDREFPAWADLVARAAQAGVDAFIVQDLGSAGVLKQICPDVPLHASTQMTVHNTPSALSLKEFGFSRIILSRELTAAQVARIGQNAGIQTEVFVHGALCYCYSGQCLMSSMLGGRSANRGTCAQTCRLNYTLGDKSGYLLSTKDLCLVDYMGILRQAGVTSLKIEGRMKGPEYIAAVTRVYRKAMDGDLIEQKDYDMLALAFNRGGFTSGLFSVDEHRLYSKQPNHIGLSAGKIATITPKSILVKDGRPLFEGDEIRPALPDAPTAKIEAVSVQGSIQEIFINDTRAYKKDMRLRQVSSAALKKELMESVRANNRKMPLYASIKINEGLPAILEVHTHKNIITYVASTQVAQHARNRPVTYTDIQNQLEKTGDLPFYFKKIDYNLSPDTAFPFSGLNALRREALKDISNKILEPYRHQAAAYTPATGRPNTTRTPRLAAQVHTLEQAQAIWDHIDLLYIPLNAKWRAKLPDSIPIAGVYPHITSDRSLKELLPYEQQFDTVLVNGLLHTDKSKLGDFGLNVSNSHTLAQLAKMGFTRATASLELNTAQINDLLLPEHMELELIVYGRATLMVSEHCPVDCDRKSCIAKEQTLILTDRKGKQFPVLWEGSHCRVRILNSLPIWMADELSTLHADVLRMVFTTESAQECGEIAAKYRMALNGGAESEADFSCHKEYTRGHYHRGW